jgi:hypothetical protein
MWKLGSCGIPLIRPPVTKLASFPIVRNQNKVGHAVCVTVSKVSVKYPHSLVQKEESEKVHPKTVVSPYPGEILQET